MGAVIKNGKLHTINIYIRKILLFIIASLSITSAYSGAEPEKKWVIVIDAGHGGKDPGAIGSFSREKDINLAIALKTGQYIEKNISNVKVVYTRKGDNTIDLYDRPKIANENNADLFISIHTNKTNSRSVMGAETYIMGHTKDQQNLEVAMKENEVIYLEDDYSTKYQGFDPKSSESYIMFTLTQSVFQKQSTDLAARIQDQFTEKLERKNRGVKQAGFWVLFNTTMPSVLIETGFISNPAEEKFLNSEKGQDFVAASIFKACRDYIEEIRRKSVITVMKDTLKVPSDTVAPAITAGNQIAYMVQVAASAVKTEISPENFKGLKDIYELNIDGRFKYASGKFSEYPEALKYRKELKKIYPDAFVIAVRDNQILPLQQALNQSKKK